MNTENNGVTFLTVRDTFAAATLTGLLTDHSYCHEISTFKKLAERAFLMANMMMAERSKE